jgi:uridine phosphorylase
MGNIASVIVYNRILHNQLTTNLIQKEVCLMTENRIQPHLKLSKVNKCCFLSGNPDRVPVIASFLKESQKVSEHRGLVAYEGFSPQKNVPVTVLTTGMGCPSTAIVLEEAYRAGGRIFIRIGSCGSLQPGQEMDIGSIYIPHAAIRNEGTSHQLAPIEFPAAASPTVHQTLCNAAKVHEIQYVVGVVWSTDIYYSANPNQFKEWAKYGAVCVEMESATLFIFGSIKGDVLSGTILTSDGNLAEQTDIYSGNVEKKYNQFQEGVKKSIICAVEAIDMIKTV